MEMTMKRVAGIAVAVALALGTAVVAAQPSGTGGGMGGSGGGMMGGGSGSGMMGGGSDAGMMGGGAGGGGMMGGGAGGGMMGAEKGAGMGGPGMMGSIDERLAAQKSALKITPDQESAWTAYAGVVKKQSEAARAQHEALSKSAPTSSAERFELRSKFMKERAAQFDAQSAAYKNLYSALTPEQRKIADQRGGHGH